MLIPGLKVKQITFSSWLEAHVFQVAPCNLEPLSFNGVIEQLCLVCHLMTIIWYNLKEELLLSKMPLLS